MSVKKKFIWGKQEFGLREFVSELSYHLPLVVKVSQGYCGHDGYTYTFGTDEEYRISHIKEQRRVVVRDSCRRRLSIPEEYPNSFHTLQNGKVFSKRPVPLQHLINHLRPGMFIKSESQSRLHFWIGGETTLTTDNKPLEVLDFFDDRFLVGNPVQNGMFKHRAVVIPLFVNIKLVLAEGLLSGTVEDFRKVLNDLDDSAKACNNNAIQGNPEIMLYEDSHMMPSFDYEYLEPMSNLGCSQAAALRQDILPAEPLTNNPAYGADMKKHPPPPTKPKPNSRIGKPRPLTDAPKNVIFRSKGEKLQMSQLKIPNIGEEIKRVRLKPTHMPYSVSSLPSISKIGRNHVQLSFSSQPEPIGKELKLKKANITEETKRARLKPTHLPHSVSTYPSLSKIDQNHLQLSFGRQPEPIVKKIHYDNKPPDIPKKSKSYLTLINEQMGKAYCSPYTQVHSGVSMSLNNVSINNRSENGNFKTQGKAVQMHPLKIANIAEDIKRVRLKPTHGPHSVSTYPSSSKIDRNHVESSLSHQPIGKECDHYDDKSPNYPEGSKPYHTFIKEQLDNAYCLPYTEIGDVPVSLKDVSVKGITETLRLLHLEKYIDIFLENTIDGALLMDLDVNILVHNLGLSQFHATKLHKFVHDGWRPKKM